MKAAFTLLETLVVFTVVAVLVAIAIPATTRVSQYSARMKAIANMRQIGVAAMLYASDHNQQLPGHVSDAGVLPLDAGGTWPQLFCQYLSPTNPRVFLDPSDKQTAQLLPDAVLSQSVNNTGYIYNGFDDLGANDGQPVSMVPLNRLQTPSQVILLAPKTQGATEFYADLLLAPLSDLLSQFNPSVYDGGANYLFADGSVRFLKQSEYSNNFWLVDKSVPLPPLPIPPFTNSQTVVAANASSSQRAPRLLADANRP